MKSYVSFLRVLVLVALCMMAFVISNADAAGHWRTITVTQLSGTPATNIQVPVVVDWATLTSASPAGSDLRFALPDALLSHFIEPGTWGTSRSLAWVKVPSIPPFGSTSFKMYYGDPSLGLESDFNSTFPSSYHLAGGTVTLSGAQNFESFEVGPGATVIVTGESPFSIAGRRVVIGGSINAAGRGWQSSTGPFADGVGPGAGGGGNGGGGGGGGYGGAGGSGGGDPHGLGGAIYGSENPLESAMGSSGGNALAAGGAGGGVILISASRLTVTGVVDASGASGSHAESEIGGGGGSGGGIRLFARDLVLNGTVVANGGAGGSGFLSGGGGGGGGRIKILFDHYTNSAVDIRTDGGPAGFSSLGPAEAGGGGTIHVGTFVESNLPPPEPLNVTVGSEDGGPTPTAHGSWGWIKALYR
jgi:Domain of unknown function (DUF2341)